MIDPGKYTLRIQGGDKKVAAKTAYDFVQQGQSVTS
jgi:hypothetical protein